MAVDAGWLKAPIERELVQLSDARVMAHVRELLVEPRAFLCDWDYGEAGQQYVCWEVLKNWIVYCESGFGPKNPWGLVDLERGASMGMDSGWYPLFLDAYFESWPATDLPIWRVFKTGQVFASQLRKKAPGTPPGNR